MRHQRLTYDHIMQCRRNLWLSTPQGIAVLCSTRLGIIITLGRFQGQNWLPFQKHLIQSDTIYDGRGWLLPELLHTLRTTEPIPLTSPYPKISLYQDKPS